MSSRPTVRGPWPEGGVAVEVTRRGEFTIEAGLRDRDPDAFARAFASSLPDIYDGKLDVSSRREGKVDRFRWRIIRVVAA